MVDKDAIFPQVSRKEKRKQANRQSRANFLVDVKLFVTAALLVAAFLGTSLLLYWKGFPAEVIQLLPFGGVASAGVAPDGFAAANELLQTPPGASFVRQNAKSPKQIIGLMKPEVQDKKIVVNIPSRTLDLYAGTKLLKSYPVAVGKLSTPTPLGTYSILQKEINPLWYPPNRSLVVPSGPQNPLGYRWIGFAPLYGIHGTNVPEQIGAAASNGCIRMYEPDVEELFETVSSGVAVQITYDLVNVAVDDKGQVFVSAYSDIYGYKNEELTLAEARDKLSIYRLAGFAGEEQLRSLIRAHTGQPVLFAKIHKLKVNGRTLDDWAVSLGGAALVPVWPLAAAFQKDVIWNEYNNTVRCGEQFVSGIVKGEVVYVTPESALALFGGMKLWNPKDNSLEFGIQPLGKKR
ncbi:MAG: L,D-transpeptidase [Pelosinus sp.]|nr:L,D-transpeptidase [Pelosinus sp.]